MLLTGDFCRSGVGSPGCRQLLRLRPSSWSLVELLELSESLELVGVVGVAGVCRSRWRLLKLPESDGVWPSPFHWSLDFLVILGTVFYFRFFVAL